MNWQTAYRGLLRLVPKMPADGSEGSMRLKSVVRACYRRGITIEDELSSQKDNSESTSTKAAKKQNRGDSK
jgi:hypothetical protein